MDQIYGRLRAIPAPLERSAPVLIRLRLESRGLIRSRPQTSTQAKEIIAHPFSLQDLCLLRVINDVDSYPEELLASLPLWMRQRVLSNLPVLDLSHLGHTSMARDVNIDQIWIKKLEQKNERIRLSALTQTRSNPVRPTFIESLFQMSVYQSNTTNERNTIMVRLKNETETALRSCPPSVRSEEECLMKLTGDVLMCPRNTAIGRVVGHKLVSLQGSSLSDQLGITGNVWPNQPTSLIQSVQKLSRTGSSLLVSDVLLTPHRLLPIYQRADSIELLSLLVHRCKVRPRSICLDVDLMSQPILDNIHAENVAITHSLAVNHQTVSCLSTMKSLMEDVVVLRVESTQHSRAIGPMMSLIEAAAGNGKLKSLFCYIPSLYLETIQPLSKLFFVRHFYMLHIEVTDLSPRSTIKLLQAFMTANCELTQKLVISPRTSIRQIPFLVKRQLASLDMGSATVPECALHHKTILSYPKEFTLQYLLLLPSIRLTELQLTPTSATDSYFHLSACHPDLHVKKLELNLIKYIAVDKLKLLKETIKNDLVLLLAKPTLQELSITGSWEGFQEAKEGLLLGLRQQAQPHFQFRSLTLNMLGFSDKDVQDLLEVIVSFPEHYRPRVFREKMFLSTVKKLSTIKTYDVVYRFQDGFVTKFLTKIN